MPPLTAFSTQSLPTQTRLWLLALGLVWWTSGCVDTRLPDLSADYGPERTAAAYCTTDVLASFPPEELRIHIIDVGQGDAIFVQTPWFDDRFAESRSVLVDAGPSGGVEGTVDGGAVVTNYLLSQGLQFGDILHALVVTHAHDDHFGGVATVFAAFEVGAYVDPGFAGGSQSFLATRALAEDRVRSVNGRIARPAVPALAPAVFRAVDLFGPMVKATLIWAASTPLGGDADHPTSTDVNNTSVAFALQWGGRQVLLLGDVESLVEAQLVAAHDAGEINLQSAFIKVAHHGSESSSSAAFLARVFPRAGNEDWAVISSGRRTFGGGSTLPAVGTLARLKGALEPYHVLSTENGDGDKAPGTEHNDDHILVRIQADGLIEACYVP